MSDAFYDRLAASRASVRQKNKLDSMLRVAEISLQSALAKRARLKETLAKEQSDVDALEGLTLTALFHFMLGSKAQSLKKEREELVAAKLKHEQAIDTVEALRGDVKRLKTDLLLLKNADFQYEQVLADKANHIAANDRDSAKSLIELTQQIANLTADQRELKEAAVAGRAALKSLLKIQDTLASAASLGTWDMLGGGVMVTMAKHTKIDDAKDQAKIAQQKLLLFEEELADANQRLQVSLQIDGFSKFADYFFDNLISDWIVQSKIQKANTECSETIARVNTAIKQCQTRLESVEAEVRKLSERKRLLIEAG